MSEEDGIGGVALDARIKLALARFEERISALESSAKTDVRDIEAAFLDKFHDGNPLRASEAPGMASEVSSELARFFKRRSDVVQLVSRILILKDLMVTSAQARSAAEEANIGATALRELPALFNWLDALQTGRDPGPAPNVTTVRQITEAQRALYHVLESVNDAGVNVAANIEMLGDIVDLRIEYLHTFKLTNLPLSPKETLERIMTRFEHQPTSVARRAALELLKGSIIAIITPLVERQLPWTTIVDMFERLQLAIIGPRLETNPSGTDALMIVRRDLADQAEALEALIADCLRFEEALTALSANLLEPHPGQAPN